MHILSEHGSCRSAHACAHRLRSVRGAAVRVGLQRAQLLGNRAVRRRDDHRLVRRPRRAQARADLPARLAARPRSRQDPGDRSARRPDRPGRLSRLDGGRDRRAGVPHLRPEARRSRARNRPPGPRPREAEDVVAGGRRRYRRVRGRRRLDRPRSLVGAARRPRPDLGLRVGLRAHCAEAAARPHV